MKNKLLLPAIILSILLTAFIFVNVANANPSFFSVTKETSSATTSPAYLTPNTGAAAAGYVATSSLVYDMYNTVGNTTKADSLALGIQFKASSTPITLKWKYEYANGYPGYDCAVTPLKCDWYSESVDLNGATVATTTIEVRTFKEYSWVYASSTPGSLTNPQDVALKIVNVPVYARYVRATFYTNTGSSTVWAQFMPVKERDK